MNGKLEVMENSDSRYMIANGWKPHPRTTSTVSTEAYLQTSESVEQNSFLPSTRTFSPLKKKDQKVVNARRTPNGHQRIKSQKKKRKNRTHPMRFLSIAHQLQQLLIRHKRLKPRIIRIRALPHDRPPMAPLHILGLGEHLAQQLVLRAQTDVDDAVAEAELPAAHEAFVEGGLGVAVREELDVAVHGLAGAAVHDDVDGGADVGGEDLGVAAEETEDFLFGEGVGDLCGGLVGVSVWVFL